jgi:hypothetical protein
VIVRTGRRELRSLLAVPRRTLSADAGVRRVQPKRPEGISARQWKKLRGKGLPSPPAALAWFHAWEQATPEARKTLPDYAYFSRRGRQDVRVYWWQNRSGMDYLYGPGEYSLQSRLEKALGVEFR